jgi:crotonobetainyl-CoA:carnitine CoA-transferase CaiB-like acyl-CoA transferase
VPPRVTEVPSIEPAKDGWVGFCALSAAQFNEFAEMIGRPEWATDPEISRIDYRSRNAATLRPLVAEWTSIRTVDEIVDDAIARRLPCAPVGNGETLAGIEQLAARGTFVPNPTGGFLQPRPSSRLGRTPLRELGTAPRLGENAASLRARRSGNRRGRETTWPFPLRGLRVFDMTSFWAGPVVSQALAAFGAEVIKVESAQRPDGTRLGTSYGVQGDRIWERAPLFHGCNTGKLGLTLDLTRPEGRDLGRRLLAQCDILIENYTPRVAEQFGLLEPRRDDLIVVRMPAWGLEGPWRNQPGFAQTMEQVTGLGWVTGHPHGPPLVPRGPCDPNGAYHALIATMLAVFERDRSGHGQVVESALVDAALNIAAQQIIEHSAYGARLDRIGNRSRDIAPQGLYRADGTEQWVAISVETDDQWRTLAASIGRPDLAHDPVLQTVDGRRARHDDLDAAISAWCAHRAADDIVETLWPAGVAVAAVTAPRDVGGNPHLGARSFFEAVEHPVVGTIRLPRFPAAMAPRTEPFHVRPAPTLGQHNRQILADLVGLDTGELDALERNRIIGDTLA